MKFVYPEEATPIDADEASELIPTHISLQRELNEWEELNIANAVLWAKKSPKTRLLSDEYIRLLHKKMFNHTWKWAGMYRKSDKNIGVPWFRVSVDIRNLCDDANVWMEDRVFMEDEIAIRFHHRLVSIHPFPNGNGRHARMMADLLIAQLGKPMFPWGRVRLADVGDVRRRYIDALQTADRGDIQPLIAFARSGR